MSMDPYSVYGITDGPPNHYIFFCTTPYFVIFTDPPRILWGYMDPQVRSYDLEQGSQTFGPRSSLEMIEYDFFNIIETYFW